jgi:ABC-type Fe3+ transport system substrate-binding protein
MEHAAQLGAPLARVITPEYPMVSYFYGAIPKNAAHPNGAKLYVTYLMTPEGQALTWSTNVDDLHFFPESRMRAKMEAVEKKYGFKYGSADVAWQVTNEAGNAAQREVAKIFQESGK